MVALVREFGRHLNKILQDEPPQFLVPLETKGAVLLELALDSVGARVPEDVRIVYPRAFRYLPRERLGTASALVVDDIFVRGRSLREARETLVTAGVPVENVHMIALLDFATGEGNQDYDAEVRDATRRLPALPPVTKKEILLHLQHEILTKRMPSTYDHLIFEAGEVSQGQYLDVLAALSDAGRLLHYGDRGCFIASSALLDDLYDGAWDVPAKARLWYKDGTLRLAPVGAPVIPREAPPMDDAERALDALLAETLQSTHPEVRAEAEYEARLFRSRVAQAAAIMGTLEEAGIRPRIDATHLDRYYPSLSRELTDLLEATLDAEPRRALTPYPGDDGDDPSPYAAATTAILHHLRNAWEAQGEGKKPKDFEPVGLTADEVFTALPSRSTAQLHAALDYCFDLHYVTAFLGRRDGRVAQCYRTTELFNPQHYTFEEIFGSAVIYSQREPTKGWLLNKAFAIIKNVTDCPYEGRFLVHKAYYGDVTRIVRDEGMELTWPDIDTDLWQKVEVKRAEQRRRERHRDPDEAVVEFRRRKEWDEKNVVHTVTTDPRLQHQVGALDTTLFLCRQGGHNGAILLDILTAGYGGVDYIAHNLQQLLNKGQKRPTRDIQEEMERHREGASEKLALLKELFKEPDNLLSRLSRRATRLSGLTPLLAGVGSNIVDAARPFAEQNLYDVLGELADAVIDGSMAAARNDRNGLERAVAPIGIRLGDIAYTSTALGAAAHVLLPFLNALACHRRSDEHYRKHVYQVDARSERFPFILAYDLAGIRKEHAKREDIPPESLDAALNTHAYNWIIALGGKLSKGDLNGGDMRYGFFPRLHDALQAGTWFLYHADQLRGLNKFAPGSAAYGVAVTRGTVMQDALSNHEGEALNVSGHFLKGKLKEAVDEAAGQAGRPERGFAESRLWLLEHPEYRDARGPATPVTAQRRLFEGADAIDAFALDTAAYRAAHPTPWAHRGRE